MDHSQQPKRPVAQRRTVWRALNLRTLKYGSHASLFTIIVLAVIVLLYSIAMRHNQRFDVTRGQRFTLADQSVKLLKELKQPIQVFGFFKLEDRERERFADLLKQYQEHTTMLSYETIDPDRQPARAQQYQVTAYNTVVVAGNNKQEKLFRLEEAALTNAILKVTRDVKKVVYFVTGHGEPELTDSERTGYSMAKQALEEQNYVVHDLVLARQQKVPDDAAVVIVAGPRQDLLEPEREALQAFLERGGKLLLLLDPDTAPSLITLAEQYGVMLHNDVVIETNALGRLVGGDYLMPVVMAYDQHPITKDLGNLMTMFPVVRSVQVAQQLPESVSAQTLASTSPDSWAETDLQALQEGRSEFNEPGDRRGPISIAAVATIDTSSEAKATAEAPPPSEPDPGKDTAAARLVVFGDSEFANNSFFVSPGNGNLFLNTVSWLAEEGDLIAIRPRPGQSSGPVILTEAQAPLVFWLPVVVLPLVVFTSGAMVFMQRRWQQ